MDMHGAALPPRQPHISEADRAHPRFAEYQRYRSSMSALLVEADSFQSWLGSKEREARDAEIMAHPRFREFQQWMRDNKGGARMPCAFPENFNRWLKGERW